MISVKKNKQLAQQKIKKNGATENMKEKSLNDWSQYKKLPKKIQEMPKTIHFTSLNPGLQ
jgi:hypothetical protein